MKNQSTEELKSWLVISIVIYLIGWIAYGLMFFLAYLDIKWIFSHDNIFIGVWIFGHLFLFDIIQIYYELLKRKDKEKPS